MPLLKVAKLSSPPGIAVAAICIEKDSTRAQSHSGLWRLQYSWSYHMAQSALTERGASLPQNFIRLQASGVRPKAGADDAD
jgi:hypothetical protein